MNNNQSRQIDICSDQHFKKKIIKYYKEGYSLGKICRKFNVDISTVLILLKKGKIRKTKLYEIYENQGIRNEDKTYDFILRSEEYHLKKFFPNDTVGEFTTSYYYYWKNKHNNKQKKKDKCTHRVKNIQCAICGKILCDATNINIESIK